MWSQHYGPGFLHTDATKKHVSYGVEDFSTEHIEDEQGHPLRVTPVAKLTNAFTAEWNQIPAARFQNRVERLSQTLEACFRACCSATECIILGMTHSVIIFGCNVQFKMPNSMSLHNMYWCYASSFY